MTKSDLKKLSLDHPARQIRLSGEESLMLPNLARGRGLPKEILEDAIKTSPLSKSAKKVAKLIIGEEVKNASPEERHLAERYLAWAVRKQD